MPHSTLTLRFLCESNQVRLGALLVGDSRVGTAGWSVTTDRMASLYFLDNFCTPGRLPAMALLPGRSIFVGRARDMGSIAPRALLLPAEYDSEAVLALLHRIPAARRFVPTGDNPRTSATPQPVAKVADFQRTCVDGLLSGFTEKHS